MPFFPAVSLKSVKFHGVEIGIANSGEGQTDLDEGAPAGLNHGFAGVELHLLGLGEPVHSSKGSIQLHGYFFRSRWRRDFASDRRELWWHGGHGFVACCGGF